MRIQFIQNLIDIFRGKHRKLFAKNHISINKKNLKHVKLNIKGENNIIEINEPLFNKHSKIIINIFGNNNKIVVENGFHLSSILEISIGQDHPNFGEVNNSLFSIGENTSIESMKYITFNSNTFCSIGRNCMLAYDIEIFNTDAHPIFDKNTGETINKVKGITIGNHCWIGSKATILKNSILPDNSILGWGSVYTGKNRQPDCVYAGNPAKLIKQNVTWDSNGRKCGYIENI